MNGDIVEGVMPIFERKMNIVKHEILQAVPEIVGKTNLAGIPNRNR